MIDPFEFWRLVFTAALTEGAERFARVLPGAAPSEPRSGAGTDVSALPTFGRMRVELSTMRLLEEREPAPQRAPPTLIVAPYAIHDASVADFAAGHSVAHALAEGGARPIALTYWKSATPAMRDFGIDAYLSDLNVAVDDLGGRVALVGLCQGGWLAAAFAARFPAKVTRLILAGAPIDIEAAPSRVTRALASVPPQAITGVLAANGGRVLGGLASSIGAEGPFAPEFTARAALQGSEDPAIARSFDDWNRRMVDLPGAYYVQTTEWIFRENRLARGSFPALGREAPRSAIAAPIFVLAARDDEVVPAPQATAVEALCPQTRVTVRVEPGRHLSLFMGRRTVATAWRDIARWLLEADDEGFGRRGRLPKGEGRGRRRPKNQGL
jgi:poly(3-hydroxyalkanoate) synthetase